MKLRILVADDHEVVRHGICALLQSHSGWEVCCQVSDGREAVRKAKELKPDIVVLDIGMPKLNGLEATRQILQNDPQMRIVILTLIDSEQVMQEVLKAGARGFVLKSDAAKDLVAAVEALERRRTFFTPRVADLMLQGYQSGDTSGNLPTLTPREREVVQLLAEGKSSKEVAVALNVSVKTAETHRTNIMRKLQFHTVSEVIFYAIRNNIVQINPTP